MLLNRLKSSAKKTAANPLFLFFVILFMGLVIRMLLLHVRWINPDEGAHLLDARLWLEGQVPVADFGSRQPFYVLIIAAFIKVFGATLAAGRLMVLTSSMGVTALLYIWGKRWFGAWIGLFAALIYAMLPIIVIWSTIVKTEQLTILLGTSSMLLLLRGHEKQSIFLFISGLLAALAFYVRQPALYLPMAAILFLIISRRRILRNTGYYVLGYLAVTAAVFLLYLRHMSFQAILFSQLNPLNLIWSRLMHMLGLLPEQYSIVDNAGFRVLNQDMRYTLNSWYHALAFTLFIVFGAIGFLFSNRIKKGTRQHHAVMLSLCWIGFVLLLYTYQTASRGFYTQYFTEALPPLILLALISIVENGKKEKITGLLIPSLAVSIFYIIYLAQRFFWQISPGMSGYITVCLGAAFLLYFQFNRMRLSMGNVFLWIFFPLMIGAGFALLLKQAGLHDLYRFILVLLVLFIVTYGLNRLSREKVNIRHISLLYGFFYAAFFSGHIIGPTYEAVWSQSTLAEVTSYLQGNSEPSDDILSGGTIWTFQSGLRPYLNVPHPTEFYKHQYFDFELTFEKNPPQYIILDGYTKRKFSRYWEFLKEQIEKNYTKVLSADGSKYTVDIYQLIPQKRGESGFITKRIKS